MSSRGKRDTNKTRQTSMPDSTEYLRLRFTDHETARVVAVLNPASGEVAGAGCLVSAKEVLTCRHVVEAAGVDLNEFGQGAVVVRLIGARVVGRDEHPTYHARVTRVAIGADDANDLALLALDIPKNVNTNIPDAEFAIPLRHGGKSFSALGFPDGDDQGQQAGGFLRSVDATDLVQMDGNTPLLVKGGFSGAPVWSPEVGAFVGLVVTEVSGDGVAWCIPSNAISKFWPELSVRFRVPAVDRPQIHDYGEDDPNIQLFGMVSNDGRRELTARVAKNNKKDLETTYFAELTYRCLPNSPAPTGRIVTFITHPSLVGEYEDAYELFSRLDEKGVATNYFGLEEAFTVAAVGDGGETALTLDLATAPGSPKHFK